MADVLWYDRGSTELVVLDVTVNGAATTGYQTSLVPWSSRPTAWTNPATAGSDHGHLLPGTLDPGTYDLWVKVTDNPETPQAIYAHLVLT